MKDPDILYGRDIHSLYFLRNQGISVYYEAHAFPVSKARLFMEKKLFNSKNFKKLIVITEALKETYLSKIPSLKSEDILVLPDGADIPKFNVEPAFNDKNFNIGYIGQLYPGKGMEIIAELAPKLPQVMFNIVGGDEENIKYWKNKTSQYKNIRFWGQVPFSETESYRQSMDLLIAPYSNQVHSKGGQDISKWMSPLKIFEYMASKKPILASNIKVISEVLNKDNALLCDPNNISEWVDVIQNIIKNDEYKNLDHLAQNAYNDLANKYTWEARAKRLIKEIKHSV